MGPEPQAVIRDKLTRLAEYIDELAPYLKNPFARHAASKGNQRIVERLAQIIVETASDTNDLLIAEAKGSPASHARASFEQARDLGVIPATLCDRFTVHYVRMRNLILHQYDRQDTRTVFHTSRRLICDARAYAKAVDKHLRRAEPDA